MTLQRDGLEGDLLARKPLEEALAQTERSGYRRALGPWDLTSIGIAAIIGAGIFALLGDTARDHAGPAVLVSILVAGLGSLFAALAYAELASVLPGSGSAYTYVYTALGEAPAFLMGWFILMSYVVGNMTVAIVWSDYFTSGLDQLGGSLPVAVRAAPGAGGLVDVPALLISLLIAALCLPAVRGSVTINNFLVAIKIGVVIFTIALGFFLIRPANYVPFNPHGLPGITSGAALIFFAYLGFDTVSATAEEARAPRRDLPIGIVGSLLASMLLYLLMALVLTGLVPAATLAQEAPLAQAFDSRGFPWAGGIITMGALVATTTVLYAFQLALPRILHSMARDGFLPAWAEVLHPEHRTPWTLTILTGVATALGAALIPLGPVADMAVLSALWVYILVCAGVLMLKKLHPETPRKFRTPWAFPALGILVLLGLAVFGVGLLVQTALAIWAGLGLMIYGFYGHRRVVARRVRGNDSAP